eukprot:1340715-Prymnesium_polylepis.1
MLLYLSADGWVPHAAQPKAAAAATDAPNGADAAGGEEEVLLGGDSAAGGDTAAAAGGVALAVTGESAVAVRGCCLGLADLRPFCRMPLMLVADSDNAQARAATAGRAAPRAPPQAALRMR